jgi:hypothetical protein
MKCSESLVLPLTHFTVQGAVESVPYEFLKYEDNSKYLICEWSGTASVV